MDTRVSFVSAISTEFVEDFIILFKSIRKHHDNKFILFVHDLGHADLDRLIRINDIEIRELDFTHMPMFSECRIIWCKQFIFEELKQDGNYIWLDADIVILSKIDQIIDAAVKNFTIFHDKFSPEACYNKKDLYKKLNIEIKPTREKLAVNAGVIGFNPERDVVILNTIREIVSLASRDDTIKTLISCYDQGCVLATIHKLRLYYNVIDCDVMNVKPRLVIGNNIPDGLDGLLKHIQDTNQDKGLIHFTGPFKASRFRSGIPVLKALSSVDAINIGLNKLTIIITGLSEYYVKLVSNALARSTFLSASVCEFNSSKLSLDAYYTRFRSITDDIIPISLDEIHNFISEDAAILNIVYGHRLVNRLEDIVKISNVKLLCLVPSLHDYILFSLNNFELFGDSLINYGDDYLKHYRSDDRDHDINLFKIHDIETDHVFDCYVKEYIDYIRKMRNANVDILMIDEFRSLLKVPNVIGADKHVDIKSYNRIIREGELVIHKYAKDEYYRLMRSYTKLPRHLYDFNLPLYKML